MLAVAQVLLFTKAEPVAALREALATPGVLGLAVELVPLDGTVGQALRRLLARAIVVEEADAARRLLGLHGDPLLRVATCDGLLFTGAGLVRGGGASEASVGLLGRKQRLQELEERVHALERAVAEATASWAGTETTLRHCRNERRELEQSVRVDEEELLRLSVQRASQSTAFDECNARCGETQRTLGEVEADSERLAQALPDLTTDAARLHEQNEAQKSAVAASERPRFGYARRRLHVRGG